MIVLCTQDKNSKRDQLQQAQRELGAPELAAIPAIVYIEKIPARHGQEGLPASELKLVEELLEQPKARDRLQRRRAARLVHVRLRELRVRIHRRHPIPGPPPRRELATTRRRRRRMATSIRWAPRHPRAATWSYLISLVLTQVIFLPMLGAIADYSPNKKRLLGIFSYVGAGATIAMFSLTDGMYLPGGILFLIANLAFGCAVVIYNSFERLRAGRRARLGFLPRAGASVTWAAASCSASTCCSTRRPNRSGYLRAGSVVNRISLGSAWLAAPSSP